MSNLNRAKELYEKINLCFTTHGNVPGFMIEDLKEICESLTDDELDSLEDGDPN
jgi:hypothetical protein